jgi:hypothetical protein
MFGHIEMNHAPFIRRNGDREGVLTATSSFCIRARQFKPAAEFA